VIMVVKNHHSSHRPLNGRRSLEPGAPRGNPGLRDGHRVCLAGLRAGVSLQPAIMLKVKDTLRSSVYLSFDGRVIKAYHGADALRRFETEVRVLQHLERRGCPFVPRLLEANPALPQIVTTNCGQRVQHLDAERLQGLFAELEAFGVHHDDADARNVTYRQKDGRFCVIDFEFSTLLEPEQAPVARPEPMHGTPDA